MKGTVNEDNDLEKRKKILQNVSDAVWWWYPWVSKRKWISIDFDLDLLSLAKRGTHTRVTEK